MNKTKSDIRLDLWNTNDESGISIPSMSNIDDHCDIEGDIKNYNSKKYLLSFTKLSSIIKK